MLTVKSCTHGTAGGVHAGLCLSYCDRAGDRPLRVSTGVCMPLTLIQRYVELKKPRARRMIGSMGTTSVVVVLSCCDTGA